jgi:ATP-dependent Clp protease ATP-binding subunit ClpA
MPFVTDRLQYIETKQINSENQKDEVHGTALNRKKVIPTRFKFDHEQVMWRLRESIYGQEKAMESIENMLKIIKADISDPDRPLYVGLFLGPTGVGKTEIVKVLAEAIHGNRNYFCRVDMNTLSLEHYAAALTGAPPGYVGSKEGSSLLDKNTIEGSFSKPGIVLLDELEKANHHVIQTLLNVLDNGMMTISSGEETINFRNSIIIMTSNLGAKDIYKFLDKPTSFLLERLLHFLNFKDQKSLLEKIVHKNLEKKFEPEFINRIDDIVVFNRIEKNIAHQMIDKYVEQLSVKLQKYNCSVQLDKSGKDYIFEKGYDKRFGGRAVRRALRKLVEVPLAELLINRSHDRPIIYRGEKRKNSENLTFTLHDHD